MPDMNASYGMPFDFIAFLGIFIHYCFPIMSELFYLHETFADCMFNQYTHTDISICQISLQVMEINLNQNLDQDTIYIRQITAK